MAENLRKMAEQGKDVEGMDIVRSYTPVFKTFAADRDDPDEEGGIHLLYKTYPDGAMTYGHLRLVNCPIYSSLSKIGLLLKLNEKIC